MIGAEVHRVIRLCHRQGAGNHGSRLISTIFPHPTLSEMMYESVLDAYGRALHM